MSVSENLKKHVVEKNLPNIRGDLVSCIMGDQNMSKIFDESLRYVLSHGISEAELFEADKGKEFETEPTEENFHRLLGLLSVNFSQKKLEALKKIACTLASPPEEKKSLELPARRSPQQERQTNWKLIAAVAAAIGILIVAGLLAMGKTGDSTKINRTSESPSQLATDYCRSSGANAMEVGAVDVGENKMKVAIVNGKEKSLPMNKSARKKMENDVAHLQTMSKTTND